MSVFQHLSVNQLIQMQTESTELQIVDIRDAASFEAGHIDGAFNLNNENLAHFIGDADMDLPLVVVCYHGISSQSAATYLNEQGFDEVFSLDGGYSAWHQANL
ncbi:MULTISPECIES: thiosulfate sulfurtransferase GlpE [Shewanella]|uniref:Thiosulfate sulfurtransferase GlpE n=1 Tax=Shewanella pneumatophori TaxID=314092 RepID=A0A9X2CEP6_9GAMM|nr:MULTISPECIES: thiosulfate sulfurtransferase GlpE [Shewanella]MCK8046348.1 thiosulfate sulfurtransferase GlpE [Shewanella sp. 1CM18E]MCL1140493.1 thiosulfate sulfurtransferase GlpE [Shewanella pneumatophori]